MSYIHETLYQTSDFASIEFSDYLNTVTRNLIHSYTTNNPILLETDLDKVYLNIDQAIPCGLIVNELVSNAIKYAYEGIDEPRLKLTVKRDKGQITLGVKDNGVGFPADFDPAKANSLGVQLVHTLVEQLDGSIVINSDSGTDIIITFDQAPQS